MVLGYSGIVTGFRPGAFSIEVNTRFGQQRGDDKDTLENLILKRNPLGTWMLRKTL